MSFKKVMAVGDLHFPYVDKKKLAATLAIIAKEKPDAVVQIGDLYDFFHFSRYPKSMLNFSPEQELKDGHEAAQDFWAKVQKLSPKAKCFQLLGNHDYRPMKRILDKAPELEAFMDVKSFFKFPKVTTSLSDRHELTLKINGTNVIFMHGHRSRLGDHMLYNEAPTVCGHSHTGGVVYKGYKSGTRWELNCGFLADATSGPLQYGQQTKRYWTTGVGMIDEKGPRFIPL